MAIHPYAPLPKCLNPSLPIIEKHSIKTWLALLKTVKIIGNTSNQLSQTKRDRGDLVTRYNVVLWKERTMEQKKKTVELKRKHAEIWIQISVNIKIQISQLWKNEPYHHWHYGELSLQLSCKFETILKLIFNFKILVLINKYLIHVHSNHTNKKAHITEIL